MLQKCNTRAAAKEVIITSIDKRAALLEHGVLPAGLLLAKGQRLPNKSKRKKRRQGTRENRRKKGRAVCDRAHRGVRKGLQNYLHICSLPFFLIQFFKFIYFLLKYSWLTMLCLFLMCRKFNETFCLVRIFC